MLFLWFFQFNDISILICVLLKLYVDCDVFDEILPFQKFASLSSFVSFDGKTLHPKSANSGALSDAASKPGHASITKQPNKSTIASSETSTPQHAAMIDLFSLQTSQEQNTKTPVDLFNDNSNQPSCSSPSEHKPSPVPSSENDCWAKFDTVHQVAPDSEANKSLPSRMPPFIQASTEIIDPFPSKQDTSQLLSSQKIAVHGEATSTTNQWHTGFTKIQNAANFISTPVSNLPVV